MGRNEGAQIVLIMSTFTGFGKAKSEEADDKCKKILLAGKMAIG